MEASETEVRSPLGSLMVERFNERSLDAASHRMLGTCAVQRVPFPGIADGK